MSELILYDLPSNGKTACWSLNPWKTRAALNYKGIPYKTEWVEYPDVAPKFKDLGIAPNDPKVNPTPYSIPTVRLPDGRFVMDSRAIADELEKLQPSPSLHLDNGYLDKTQSLVIATMPNLFTELMPRVPSVLNESSAEYFHRTRKQRFGMPLPEFAKSEKSGEVAWKNAEPHIKKLAALLKENEGPFVAGKEVSYADFILGGVWQFLQRINPEAKKRFFEHDAVFDAHLEAVSKYYERDGN